MIVSSPTIPPPSAGAGGGGGGGGGGDGLEKPISFEISLLKSKGEKDAAKLLAGKGKENEKKKKMRRRMLRSLSPKGVGLKSFIIMLVLY